VPKKKDAQLKISYAGGLYPNAENDGVWQRARKKKKDLEEKGFRFHKKLATSGEQIKSESSGEEEPHLDDQAESEKGIIST